MNEFAFEQEEEVITDDDKEGYYYEEYEDFDQDEYLMAMKDEILYL